MYSSALIKRESGGVNEREGGIQDRTVSYSILKNENSCPDVIGDSQACVDITFLLKITSSIFAQFMRSTLYIVFVVKI
jgi:hypothetical protein